MRLFVAFALLACAMPAAAAWTVPDQVAVVTEDVRLSDLVSGAPASWSRVALGKAPRPGGRRVLAREWVLQRAREVGAEGDLQIPGTVVLTRTGRTVERDEVVRAVEGALAARLGPGESLQVNSVGLPGSVPDGELALSVCEPEGVLAPSSTVWVDVFSDGRKVGRAWARVAVSRSRAVVVLARNARKGDVIRSEDLEVRIPRGVSARSALTDPGEVVGKRMVRNLPAGAPLSAGDVAAQPLVEKGDLVRLVVKVGSVMASTTGRAAEPGRAGEQLRVENPASGRVLQGTLLESGIVEVQAGLER